MAVIGGVASDGSAELEICFFSGVLEDFVKLEIRIPKRMLDSVKRVFPVKLYSMNLRSVLIRNSNRVRKGIDIFFAYLGANAASNEFEDTDIPLEKKAKSRRSRTRLTKGRRSRVKIDSAQKPRGNPSKQDKRFFCIRGESSLPVAYVRGDVNGQETLTLYATKYAKKQGKEDNALRLGILRFTSLTRRKLLRRKLGYEWPNCSRMRTAT